MIGNNDMKTGFVSIIPNVSNGKFSLSIHQDETHLLGSSFTRKNAIHEFRNYYHSELELLNKNDVKYEINFGIINYSM